MKVLFDVTHPALVHLFKHPIAAIEARGHQVHVASRDKDVTTRLLRAYGIDHRPLTAIKGGPLGRVREGITRARALIRVCRSIRPDIVVSQVDPAAAHAARLTGASALVFDDSEPEWALGGLTHPFADVVCTPHWFQRELRTEHRRYSGCHELAYLTPDRFNPDRDKLERAGVKTDERYTVVRFVDWTAHHDLGRSGFSAPGKRRLVEALDRYGAVYVISEAPLPRELTEYRMTLPPEYVHPLLAFADLYVGDSQTMATEAAVLGTPTIRSNAFVGPQDMGNFRTLESKYGLIRSVADEDQARRLARDFARSPPATRWKRRRDRLLQETIDVSDYIVETIFEVGAS